MHRFLHILFISICTVDSLFHASISHGSSLFHGSETRKSVAHIRCTRYIDILRTLFMGFSIVLIIHVHPYVMGFLVNNSRHCK